MMFFLFFSFFLQADYENMMLFNFHGGLQPYLVQMFPSTVVNDTPVYSVDDL